MFQRFGVMINREEFTIDRKTGTQIWKSDRISDYAGLFKARDNAIVAQLEKRKFAAVARPRAGAARRCRRHRSAAPPAGSGAAAATARAPRMPRRP